MGQSSLLFHRNYRIRAHPCAKRAADALFLLLNGNGMLAPGVNMLAQRKQTLWAHVRAQAAALAQILDNGQLRHFAASSCSGYKVNYKGF